MGMPNGRSLGLAVSRAFGDYCLKDFGLVSEPEVTYRKITDKDQFLILATDGVHYYIKLYSLLDQNQDFTYNNRIMMYVCM